MQLTVFPRPLDELDHLHLEPHTDGAKRGADGGRGLALAVAGVDDDESVASSLGILFRAGFFAHDRGLDGAGAPLFRLCRARTRPKIAPCGTRLQAAAA